MTGPDASVVIPTRGRPLLVPRAVRSALAQTDCSLEVIVVLDGPDRATEAALATIADGRLRVEALPLPAGPGAARNAGVRLARGDLVAFLDDDDEWVPEKLATQLAAFEAPGARGAILTCRLLARDGSSPDRVWPRRLPERGEPLSEYLLARRGLRWGETLVQTSTIVAARELLEQVPFREDIRRHEDLDWLLRAAPKAAGLVFVRPEQPLAVWHVDEGRRRASRESDPLGSLEWIRSVRPFVTRRAYAAFVLGWIVANAKGSRRVRLLPQLLWEASRRGRPAPVDLMVALGVTVVPERIQARLEGRRGNVSSSRLPRRPRRRRTRPESNAS